MTLEQLLKNSIKINPETGCWEWQGARVRGYGTLSLGDGKSKLAHRRAYEVWIAPIADGLYCLHKCDNPPCINPEHLFLGDQSKNMQDAQNKGRMRVKGPKPEPRRVLKLNRESVEEIRRLCASGVTQAEAARRFGIGQPTVWQVVHREIWANVT